MLVQIEMNAADHFSAILNIAKSDPNVLGFWLGGSRGKGHETEHSDYDCTMIVKEEALQDYRRRFQERKHDVDLSVTTLDEFAKYAEWGSSTAWDRYNFAHTKALVDKTGLVQKMIDEKGNMPPAEIVPFIRRSLDHYVNQVYRSLKCRRDGNIAGARLDAAEGCNPLLDAVFALDGRLRPYHKYLAWELKNYPMERLGFAGEELVTSLLEILSTGDTRVQQKLFVRMEGLFRSHGYGDVFDAWGDDLAWIKIYGRDSGC